MLALGHYQQIARDQGVDIEANVRWLIACEMVAQYERRALCTAVEKLYGAARVGALRPEDLRELADRLERGAA